MQHAIGNHTPADNKRNQDQRIAPSAPRHHTPTTYNTPTKRKPHPPVAIYSKFKPQGCRGRNAGVSPTFTRLLALQHDTQPYSHGFTGFSMLFVLLKLIL